MPDRDRFFFSVIGLALIAGLVFAGAINHSRERESRFQSANAQYNLASDHSVESVPVEKSLTSDAASYRQEWREEQNLQAQREMAKWAWLMMLASFAGVAITAVGVVYVAQTLIATRAAVAAANRTADEAKRIGEAQVRAYLAITSVTNSFLYTSKNGGFCPMLKIKFLNSGNSPARNYEMRVKVAYQILGSGRVASEIYLSTENWGPISPREERLHVQSFPDAALTKDEFDAIQTKLGLAVHVNISTRFDDVFGASIQDEQGFIRMYSNRDEIQEQFHMGGSPIKIDELVSYGTLIDPQRSN